MAMTERNTGKKVITGMDVGLDASFRYLESTNKIKPENVEFIYKLVKAAYYAFMDDCFDKDYIAQAYTALINNNYTELKKIAEKSSAAAFDSNNPQVRVTSMKRDSQKHALEKLLTEIFYMTAVYYTRDGYTPKLLKFFKFVCKHLVLIGLCRNGTLTIGRINEIDPLTYLNVITEFLNESKDTVYPTQKKNQITCVAIDAIERVAKKYVKIFKDSPEAILNIQLLDLLVKKIYALCYWKEWMKKEGSSLALSALMDILPDDFFIKYELSIVKALFYALNTLPEFITVTAHHNCPESLYKLIEKCHAEPHIILLKPRVIGPSKFLLDYVKRVSKVTGESPTKLELDYITNFKNIAKRLIIELKSERKFARKISKECIERLRKKENLPLEEMLNIDVATYIESSQTPEESTASEMYLMRETLLKRSWSDDFMLYEYGTITSGLDFLLYLLQQDKGGKLLGDSNELGSRLVELNNELLKILKNEIMDYDELRKSATDQSMKNYYMLLEKKHNYLNPIYEASISTIYNQPLKTEKERLESTKISAKPLTEPNETIPDFIGKIMAFKEVSNRPNLLKDDFYIYKVFPKAEARLKAVCACVTFLCNEFLKTLNEKDWANTVLSNELKAIHNDQRHKYLILIFRLLQRDEKCLYKKVKNCLTQLYKNRTDQEEVFPDKISHSCLTGAFAIKISDLSEYKKLIRIVKLFPKAFLKSFWEKISESFKTILKKLAEASVHKTENVKVKHNTEFHVACFLINSYQYKYNREDDTEIFKLNIDRVIELQRLIYVFKMSDTILKDPLANLFNRFDSVAIQYIKDQHAKESATDGMHEMKLGVLLKLTAYVLKSKKAGQFREYMAKNSSELLLDILVRNCRNPERYNVIHEVLSIVYELNKCYPVWLKQQKVLIHNITKVWQSFISEIEVIQKRIWYLQGDFLMVINLLLAYLTLCPMDVDAAYLLLEFIKNPEYICIHELRQFLCYELCVIIPVEAYKNYVETYLTILKSNTIDEKQCFNATSYLIIPLMFNFYKKKLVDIALDKSLEGILLNAIFSPRTWKPIVQRRLIRLGVLILDNIAQEKVELSKRTVVLDIWKKIKSEDLGTKAWAFLALAKFANKVLMPNERIQEVIHAFFGDNHGDYRDVVAAAIDSFVPVMFKPKEQQKQFEQNLLLLERTIRINAASLISLSNVFGMVMRNQSVFKVYKQTLYPRMIQAFQKIFFYSKPLAAKSLAFDLAKVMLLWSTDTTTEKKLKDTETQIKDIIATCIFKELYQLHYILDAEDATDKEYVELTYKCLVMLRSILISPNNSEFKFNINEKRSSSNTSKESLLQITMLNVVMIIIKYYNKKKVEDNIKKIFEAIQCTLKCKWPGKSDPYSPQKYPHIIEALSRFYPNEWKDILIKIFSQDLDIFFMEIKNFDKTAQQIRDENKAGMQERTQIKSYQEQIYYLIPHLTIRLCALHTKLGIQILNEKIDDLFNCWNYMCKIFNKYLKLCERFQMYPFPRGSSTSQQSNLSKDHAGWEWLSKDDIDIVLPNTEGLNMDLYIRETIIQATHYLADKVIENPKYAHKYFDILINIFEKDCIDEVVLIEIVKAARKVIMSDAKIIVKMDQTQSMGYQHPSQGNRSKLIGRLQERMPIGLEQASNELLELTYDYLKNVTEVKDHHKKILNYTLIQLKNKSLSIRSKFFSLFDQYYGKSVYKRLQHIFLQQNWDYSKDSKDSFWIQQDLDLLLSSIDEEAPMQREPGGVVLLAFRDKKPLKTDMVDVLPPALQTIIDDNEKVVCKLKTKKTKYWLRPLKDVTNWEHHICEKLWLKLFPQFWNIMSADEQQQIASLIEPFLTKEEFLKQMQGKRPNAVRTMFEAVSACDPLPKLAPEIIQFLGKNYGAWHTALPLLESYLYAYPGNERYYTSMNIILKHLSETDYTLGLQRYIAKMPITHAALSYGQFQLWNSVDDLLSVEIMKNIKLTNGKDSIKEIESEDLTQSKQDINNLLTQVDFRIWEEWETEAALNLNKWEMLKALGASTNKTSLTMQCYWSTHDWTNFIETSKKVGDSEIPTSLLVQLYDHIQQQGSENDSERDNIYKRGLKAFYTEWNMLPNIVDAPHYQSIIVQEHFLETNEYKNMYKELKDSMQRQVEFDFKSYLSTWRERLPNKCEPFTVWCDLLGCRNFLFNQLKTKLASSPSFARFEQNIHDIPWNYLKLAEVARKHGLIDQALQYLGEADKQIKETGDIHNHERFLRAKETAKLSLKLDSEWEGAAEYLKTVEKQSYCKKSNVALSEIMRLRGELLNKMNKTRDAYDEFNSATNECIHNYKAWESYAMFFEAQYEIKKDTESNSYALKGYIHAAIYMLSKSKYYLPRVLSCLERDGKVIQIAGNLENFTMKLFKEHIINLPTWVWIYWLPQIIRNLEHSHIERESSLIILRNIAKLYPQPLFTYLRRIKEKNAIVPNESLLIDINDIWTKLQEREREWHILECIEKMLDELEKKVLVNISKEDELLLHLKQLYNACIPIVPSSLFFNLIKQINERYFEVDQEKFLDLQSLYKEKFHRDFITNEAKTQSIVELLTKLRNWIDYLHTKVTLRAEQHSIDGYSQELANYMPKRIEMFGVNYQKESEPTPESTVYITRLETKVEKTYQRTRVDFRGTNEKNYNYYLQNYNGNEHIEILMNQLRNYLNRVFVSNRYTMMRNIRLHSPYSLYWGNMKMTLDEQHIMPMSDLHDAALIERGLHPEHALISYLKKVSESINAPRPEEDLNKEVIQEMKFLLGDYIFAGFIHKLVSNPDELFIYKKQFTSYLAAQSFFSYIFNVSHTDLNSLLFCKRTGKIYYSSYQQNLVGIENDVKVSSVPFRLTPNLQYFITPIGIEGPFAGSITAATYAVQGKKLQYLKGYLQLYYKDIVEDYTKEEVAKKVEENCVRTTEAIRGLLNLKLLDKVFTARHAVFKGDGFEAEEANLPKPEDKKEEAICFNQEVYQKIKEAQDIERMKKMPLIWASWF